MGRHRHLHTLHVYVTLLRGPSHEYIEQEGPLSQTNRAATWANSGKIGLQAYVRCEKRTSNIAVRRKRHYFGNAEQFGRIVANVQIA